jgi:hypothetical protein
MPLRIAWVSIPWLVAYPLASHKRPMPAELFDPKLRAVRRDRACRQGVELFLYERAFTDCLERIELIGRRFRSCLLVGCPDREWPERLRPVAEQVYAVDPGALFSRAGGALQADEIDLPSEPGRHDLCVAIGTLDTINDLPLALLAIRGALEPDGLFIGALSGGETLPQLRSAMRAADAVQGSAAPHVHPRIEASALAPLLAAAGFVNPVVDVDRVPVSYRSLLDLVRDLRRMGTTNILMQRSQRPLGKAARQAALDAFTSAGDGTRTTETFELLHFAAWTPPAREG